MLMIAAVPMLVGIGALGVDLLHMEAVRSELQKACDAGALAGALVLLQNPAEVEESARTIAGLNIADGRAVSSYSDQTTVSVDVTAPSLNDPGRVKVTASMVTGNSFGRIVGRPTELVVTSATAGPRGLARTVPAGQLFPLAASWDAVPENDVALKDRKLGDIVKLYVNSQQVKNAAFTGFDSTADAGYISSAIDAYLKLSDPDPSQQRSAVIAGESKVNLNNGVAGQKRLAYPGHKAALLERKILYLPVILGTPPINQDATVIGFITIEVLDVEINGAGGIVQTITGRLVKGLRGGRSGGSEGIDPGLVAMEPFSVKLIE